ncbi:MAG: 5'-nucleotidase C-terminal domain-containing protein [Siphonobacter sp.]
MMNNRWAFFLGMFLLSACSSTQYFAGHALHSALIPVTDTTAAASKESKALATYLQTYHDSLNRSMNQILVKSAKRLHKGGVESELGDLMADLFLEQGQKHYGSPIDVAQMNTGGIRAEILAGNVTLGNVYEIMPFDNDLVVLTLSGETMKQFIDYVAARQDPQSGMRLVLDKDTRKPIEITIQGKPFDPSKTYKIVVSDYVATGGDSAVFLKNCLKSEPLHYLMRDAIRDYFIAKGQKNEVLNPQLDGRTTVR